MLTVRQKKRQEVDERRGNKEEKRREEDMTQWKWRDNLKQRNSRSWRGRFCTIKADSRNLYFSSVGNLTRSFVKYSANGQRGKLFCFTLLLASLISVGASAAQLIQQNFYVCLVSRFGFSEPQVQTLCCSCASHMKNRTVYKERFW